MIPAGQAVPSAFIEVARRARRAGDAAELAFIAVNDTALLAAYRQAVLWFGIGGVRALSGVVRPEANAPYVHWLERVCSALVATRHEPVAVDASVLAADLAEEWAEWLPAYGLWLPLAPAPSVGEAALLASGGGLLLARDVPWQADEIALLAEWLELWRHAWLTGSGSQAWSLARAWRVVRNYFEPRAGVTWWRQRWARWALAVGLVLLCPVRLSVLAPGELVPTRPAMIRAPLDGTVGKFHVQPNQSVKAGQVLFEFDKAPLEARYDVASQSLATAQAEYRQSAQLALSDAKSKAQMALVQGKIDERKAEADFLHGQLERALVVAPHDGVALFDDPFEWIGKPVVTGERIMRIAAPDDVEIEAWLPVGDAIPLAAGASASLFLNASPLSSVTGALRYVAHDAVQRPEGGYAYRVRAALREPTTHRVGLKGTARLNGRWVPLMYWVMRRPLASLRQTIGW